MLNFIFLVCMLSFVVSVAYALLSYSAPSKK